MCGLLECVTLCVWVIGVCDTRVCVCVCRFQLDHAQPNLIWNLKTREELRDSLEGEMRSFGVDRELGSASVISWNHQEFEVSGCNYDLLLLFSDYYYYDLLKLFSRNYYFFFVFYCIFFCFCHENSLRC